MADVKDISDYSGNSRHASPAGVLRQALAEVTTGELVRCKKAIVILLMDDDDGYEICQRIANLRAHEIVALLRVVSVDYEMQLAGVEVE